MKTYKVISPYRIRDKQGNLLPDYAQIGEHVELAVSDAKRLTKAKCVEEIETQTVSAPENRSRRKKRDTNAGKRVNS